MAQGELVGSPLRREATIPKRILGASLTAYSGDVHSIVIDPAMMAPKMMRQKQPRLPAKISQKIANIIPPDAFQPQLRQKQVAIEVRSAAILSLSSWGLVGKKGISLFFLRMNTRLQTNVISMVKKINWTGLMFSCLAMDRLMHSKIGPKRRRVTGENYISGYSANSLYSYQCLSRFQSFLLMSFYYMRFLAWASFLSIAFQKRANTMLFTYSTLGLGRDLYIVRVE